MHLLLVEDDAELSASLCAALRRSGHAVDTASSGEEALSALETQQHDLIILDLGLPKLDGLEVLRRIRGRQDVTPVLVLTARDAVQSRVQALDAGADDYLLKPFDVRELEARMRAITRRAVAGSATDVRAGRLTLVAAERCICVDDKRLDLSPREFGLLELLIESRNRVVSKSQIQSRLCEWDQELTDGAIEVHIHRVRRKLANSGANIRTVRGFGYLLEVVDE